MAFISGQHYAICDRCGFRFLSGELRKTWDNLLVCSKDWEPQHPQEKIRGVKERSIKDARPETEPIYLNPGDVTSDDL